MPIRSEQLAAQLAKLAESVGKRIYLPPHRRLAQRTHRSAQNMGQLILWQQLKHAIRDRNIVFELAIVARGLFVELSANMNQLRHWARPSCRHMRAHELSPRFKELLRGGN
jgi:hypothetical protein